MQNTTIIQKLQAKKNKKGFTLVELVIVIAILAILAAIAIPVVISTINSANNSTFESDKATCEMLLKAAINEQKANVTTTYNNGTTDTADDITVGKDAPITLSVVLKTNGIDDPANFLTKKIDGKDYYMIWDATKQTLSVGTSGAALAATTEIDKDGIVSKTTDIAAPTT